MAEAGDGQETVICFEEIHPDAILMDLLVPGMDDIEATPTIARKLLQEIARLAEVQPAPEAFIAGELTDADTAGA